MQDNNFEIKIKPLEREVQWDERKKKNRRGENVGTFK